MFDSKAVSILVGGLVLAAALSSPDEARAQQTGFCTPTQTVSAAPDADGVYTTTLACADTSAAAGEADYRQLHYNGIAWVESGQTNPADRNTGLANNDADNHLSVTIGPGVVFTADKYIDQRSVVTDGAIVLWNAGAGDKTVTVQDGAVINLERTPEYWHPTTDPDRRVVRTDEGGAVVYDPAWYPAWSDALDGLTAIAVHSNTGDGDSDVAVRLDGEINVDINVGGTYGKNDRYDASAGRAIDVQIKDTGAAGDARADLDALVELGSTGVIRHVEGSDGLGGIYVENRSEEGDITINLAAGSLIDVSEGGGYGVLALGWTHANNNGAKTGDMTINAAGTIRTALPQGRVQSNNFGHGIFASQGADGRLLVTSSGTIEAVQASAIDARAYRSTNMHSDDPDTPEIEGHLVDVTGGLVEARGNTAIYTSTGSVNADMTVRVAAGATVRARALTNEDYENGAATQAELGTTGNGRLQVPQYRFYGWRQVEVMREVSGEMVPETVSEPIIVGIAMRDYTSDPAAEGVMDQMLVDGTVEAIGGKADVDPAIWMERGGRLVVGATGRVKADSGLAIEAGCVSSYRSGFTDPAGATTDCGSKPARDLDVTVAGTVEGGIRLRGDGDLTATVMGTVEGDVRTMGAGDLTLSVPEGGVVTGTAYDPAGPLTVAGSIGRLLYGGGATVTVAATGRLIGVEVDGKTEALRSEAGDLSMTVAGMVTGDVLGRGAGDHVVTVARGGVVTGTIHLSGSTVRVDGSAGCVLLDRGGTVTVGATGRIACADGGIHSETGDLTATVSGRVEGDVRALGAGEHRVTVAEGGTVTGTVRVATRSAVTIGGPVGSVRLDMGGAVTVGAGGAVAGDVDGIGVGSDQGELVVTIRQGAGEAPGAAALRVQGRIVEAGGTPEILFQAAGEDEARPLGAPDGMASLPDGPFQVGVVEDDEGGLEVRQVYAPRSRVYEALPSVLLGLGVPPAHRDRLAGRRGAHGTWARAEAGGGERRAKSSTSTSGPGIAWDHRSWGVSAGVDFTLGPAALAGVSAHHRHGTANLAGADGRIEVSGTGFGLSAAYTFGDGFYADGQFQATWYEANLSSTGPGGTLKSGANGSGWAAGLEAGRRVDLGPGLLGEMTLTPRARLVRSNVKVGAFTDSVGARVSVKGVRSLMGRAGLELETSGEGGSRLFGSVEMEREFQPGTQAEVSGTKLSSVEAGARVLAELGVVQSWDEGQWTLESVVRYATAAGRGAARDYGGRLSLAVRF